MSFEICFKKLTDGPLPEVIYIDSSFWVKLLIKGMFYHNEAIAFMERLEKNNTLLVTSILTIAEIKCAALKINVAKHIAQQRNIDERDVDTVKEIKKDPELIKKFHSSVEGIKKDFFAIWNRFEHRMFVPLNEDVMANVGSIMGKYRLASYDAIHVSSIEYMGGIKNIAVFDRDIENLPRYMGEVYIWSVGAWNRYKYRHNVSKNN